MDMNLQDFLSDTMMSNDFFDLIFSCYFMGINDETLNEILDSLENSMKNLAFLHLHEHSDWPKMKDFLEQQYETLLENLLEDKATSIHHLESGIKNTIIVKKNKIFESLEKEFKR